MNLRFLSKGFARLVEPKTPLPTERQRFTNDGIVRLMVPVVAEQFLNLLVGIADTLMVSYAGEAAVSGVSLVNQLNNVFIMLFTGLAVGGTVIASQYIGRGDRENGVTASSQLLMVTTLIGIVLMVLSLVFGDAIFGALFGRVSDDVHAAGMTYLRITAVSLPFMAAYNACAGLFRVMGRTKTIMNVSIGMNAINVAGNAIGVFWMHAGVAGVAYPTLLSRLYAAGIMLYLISNQNNVLFIRARETLRWDSVMINRIFNVAVPSSLENGLFQFSKVALTSMVAIFGTSQIAANGIAQTYWSMSSLFHVSLGPVFIAVVGQYMGAGDSEGANYYMHKLLRIAYVGGGIWHLSFLAVTPLILMLYSISDETRHLVIFLVVFHGIFNGLLCPLAFGLPNGLRAAGDARFTMFASIFSSVGCRVAFSYLFVIVMRMGVVGIVIAMIGDWFVKSALIVWRWHSGVWKTIRVI